MKFVIAGSFAYNYPNHVWDKPLSPIIGETFQAYIADGSKIYAE
jgi:hypothetical protein